MKRGRLPVKTPRLLIEQTGDYYDVRRPTDSSSEGRQTNDLGEYVGDTEENTTVFEDTLMAFHDRHMDVEETDGGERRVEKIQSSTYPDAPIRKDDRVTHDGIEWECETVEAKPFVSNPSFIRGTWKKRTEK